MKKTAVILQPCFFPWRGQFDLFSQGDTCIFLDNVQYVRRHWFNRNKIMTKDGPKWITVPVQIKGNYDIEIKDVRISQETRWQDAMLKTLYHAYRRAPHFDRYYGSLSEVLQRDWELLGELATASTLWAADQLGLHLAYTVASKLDLAPVEDAVERLVVLCQQAGASRYVSGPSARAYIGEGAPFARAGIELAWMHYPDYPPYRPEESEPLSILDLLFCHGPKAADFIWPQGGKAGIHPTEVS